MGFLEPQDSFVIIRDKFSRLFKDTRREAMSDVLEFLSELWDGYVESYRTRKYGLEGGVDAYAVLLAASSPYFFKLLSSQEEFFVQGLGNRFLYIVEKNPRVKKIINPDDFFFGPGSSDEKWRKLKKEVIDELNQLKQVKTAYVKPEARKLWVDFYNSYLEKVSKLDELEGSYLTKVPLNALKLALIYAASRLDFRNEVLNVTEEDMTRAIEDMRKFEAQYQELMTWWNEYAGQLKSVKKISRASKYDLQEFMRKIAILGQGYATVKEISAWCDAPNRNQIAELLGLGVAKGWLEVLEEKDVPKELYERFKPKAGVYPQVFRLTSKGYEAIGLQREY